MSRLTIISSKHKELLFSTFKHINILRMVNNRIKSNKNIITPYINDYISNWGNDNNWLDRTTGKLKNDDPSIFTLTTWVSHVHKLRPYFYHKDCINKTISFDLFEASKRQEKNFEYADKIARDIPILQYPQNFFENYIKFLDIRKQDDKYLSDMIDDYLKFLDLSAASRQYLVPTIPIDIVWQGHMTNNFKYLKDVHDITGKIIDRDGNTITEESFESQRKSPEKLSDKEYEERIGTLKLWAMKYEEELEKKQSILTQQRIKFMISEPVNLDVNKYPVAYEHVSCNPSRPPHSWTD